MSHLLCPACRAPLTKGEKSFSCPKGHSFDIAKQGYVNLLLGGGKQHGDNALMIKARGRFLSGGYYSPLANALTEAVSSRLKHDSALLDIGCGEGYYTAALREALGKGGKIYAFDISKDALKATAARHPNATLFVASAYSVPIADESMDGVCLFFSPYAREEILRVLKKGGFFFMAIPDERHLLGLKRVLYDTPYLNRPERTEIEGFRLLSDIAVTDEITLPDVQTIQDLFSMTPYYYKTSPKDKEKLASLSSLQTEICFRLLVYEKL